MSNLPESEMHGWGDDDDYLVEISKNKYDQDLTNSFNAGYLLGGVCALALALLVGMAIGYS